ncbi:hypothetical protein CI109_102226 [Kwoniella shandongensis]|uniref:Uncharacterized protein n=1 Tax=Kwoniella shandongensis TaxID=1734106 RepID=A0A5M6BYQ7_9TREE|nr:uncharacterized protein CI109_003620 [Kwoniella shandongensis]KAA5527966.1 hypothetical protein CI109_003620 [Kwoniella shandongensis]
MARSNLFTRSLVLLALLGSALAARPDIPCATDPYADPAHDICNPLRYIPNKPINIVAAVLYFIVAIILSYRLYRQKANYFMCLVIGAWFEALGLVLRVVFRSNPHSTGLYIVCYLFVVLSPCAFLAGDYILLGRLVQYLEGERYLRPLKPQWVSTTFIVSDVITFLIQAAGGGLSISKNVTTAQTGGHIFLAGIAAQMASFILFTVMWAVFGFRARSMDKDLWSRPGWKSLYWALGFTCICFLIRSVYRTVELSQGYVGYIATHERFYLGLDTLPLLLGIAVYTYYWPGAYLKFAPKVKKSKKGAAVEEGLPIGETVERDRTPTIQDDRSSAEKEAAYVATR